MEITATAVRPVPLELRLSGDSKNCILKLDVRLALGVHEGWWQLMVKKKDLGKESVMYP